LKPNATYAPGSLPPTLRRREIERTDGHGESCCKTLLAMARPFVTASQAPQGGDAPSTAKEAAADAFVPKPSSEPKTLPMPMIVALALASSSSLTSAEVLNASAPAGVSSSVPVVRTGASPTATPTSDGHSEGIAIHAAPTTTHLGRLPTAWQLDNL